jgi:hypothetical protein
MTIRSAAHVRAWLSLLVCASAVTIYGCGSSDSPTSPTPITQPGPAPAPTPTPTPTPTPARGVLSIAINPNPVPHSGAAITDAAGCANVRFTWFYDQVLSDTGGSAITLTNRIDLFDNRETNNTTVNITVPANGSTTIRSRWCSSNGVAHTSQTRWSGTDAAGNPISVLGPLVELRQP